MPPPVPPPVYSRRAAGSAPKPPKPRSALVAVTFSLLAILAGILALAGADVVTGLALALLMVAGAMIVGAWRGRARGLIPIAIVLSGALFMASLLDVPFRAGRASGCTCPLRWRMSTRPTGCRRGSCGSTCGGSTWPAALFRWWPASASGTLIVTVPAGVAVEVDAEVGAGEMIIFGRNWEGIGIDERVAIGGQEGAGRLVLDARVGLGELEVRRAAA